MWKVKLRRSWGVDAQDLAWFESPCLERASKHCKSGKSKRGPQPRIIRIDTIICLNIAWKRGTDLLEPSEGHLSSLHGSSKPGGTQEGDGSTYSFPMFGINGYQRCTPSQTPPSRDITLSSFWKRVLQLGRSLCLGPHIDTQHRS
jgi:hypothetical protein